MSRFRPRLAVSGRGLLSASLLILVVTALACPRTLYGTAAGFLAAGVIGAAVIPRLAGFVRALPSLPTPVARASACLVVVAAAALVFLPQDARVLDLEKGDWTIHVYLVEQLVAGLDHGRIPGYVQGLGTGDPTYELYPLATHWCAAQLARALDMRDSVPTLLGWIAIVGYVLLAVNVTRLASRMAPWGLAAAVGVASLLDAGRLFAGGAIATLYYALLDQTFATVLALFGAVAVTDVLESPRWHGPPRIWLFIALAALAHPTGLILSGALFGGLIVVALLARDVRARTALLAALHVLIGFLASAVVWAPYAARVLDWGASYPGAAKEPAAVLAEIIGGMLPASSYPALVLSGVAGVIVGLLSRRAVPTLVASIGLLLLFGYSDIPFQLSGFGTSEATARLAAFRLPGLAKPFLFACAALFGVLMSRGLHAVVWPRVQSRSRVAGALVGVAILIVARAVVPYGADRTWEVRETLRGRIDDRRGYDELVRWVRSHADEHPGRFSRVLFESTDHYVQDMASETGLPVLHAGGIPIAFLRERMVELRPETLHRFGVRWVARRGRPPNLGDPATQVRFGTYYVRVVPGWDGSFAHVEQGRGIARVTNLENDRVVVELEGTDQPALVSFAMGYYPRWRALHDGLQVPVYGFPTSEQGHGHVVAAWLPPGRTVLTADAPLPSDSRGGVASIVATLLAAMFATASFVPVVRRRTAGLVGAVQRMVRGRLTWMAACGLLLVALVLLLAGRSSGRHAVDAVTIFDGFSAGARIEASRDDEDDLVDVDDESAAQRGERDYRRCDRLGWAGVADCGRAGRVTGTMGALIGHEAFSWPWQTPAIAFTPRTERTHYRVTMVRRLAGTYEVAAAGDHAVVRLHIAGQPPRVIRRAVTEIELPETPRDYRIEVTADLPTKKPAYFSMVRPEAIDDPPEIPEPPRNH